VTWDPAAAPALETLRETRGRRCSLPARAAHSLHDSSLANTALVHAAIHPLAHRPAAYGFALRSQRTAAAGVPLHFSPRLRPQPWPSFFRLARGGLACLPRTIGPDRRPVRHSRSAPRGDSHGLLRGHPPPPSLARLAQPRAICFGSTTACYPSLGAGWSLSRSSRVWLHPQKSPTPYNRAHLITWRQDGRPSQQGAPINGKPPSPVCSLHMRAGMRGHAPAPARTAITRSRLGAAAAPAVARRLSCGIPSHGGTSLSTSNNSAPSPCKHRLPSGLAPCGSFSRLPSKGAACAPAHSLSCARRARGESLHLLRLPSKGAACAPTCTGRPPSLHRRAPHVPSKACASSRDGSPRSAPLRCSTAAPPHHRTTAPPHHGTTSQPQAPRATRPPLGKPRRMAWPCSRVPAAPMALGRGPCAALSLPPLSSKRPRTRPPRPPSRHPGAPR
jgi:hypothetical protein